MSAPARAGLLAGLVGVVALALWLLASGPPEPHTGPPPAPPSPSPPEPPLAEQALELAGPDGVVCALEPALTDERTARIELGSDRPWLGVAAVRGAVLVLSDIPEAGEGTLLVEGFAPVEVAWESAREGSGRCLEEPIRLGVAEAEVRGRIVGGARGITLTACDRPVKTAPGGTFRASATPGVPCTIEARRHYGVWEWVERREVTPERGRTPTVVEIAPPTFDAVLPVVVLDGAISEVWDDAHADLRGGRILAVDGEAVPGEPDEFHLATGGAAGDRATLRIEFTGLRSPAARCASACDPSIVERELRRRALTFEDWVIR